MFRYHYGPVAGEHWWFGLVGFVFWLAVIGGIIWLLARHHTYCQHVDQAHHAVKPQGEPTDPLDIAKSRYTRGDITQEEFTQIKKDLG